MDGLATALNTRLSPDERQAIIGVGESGTAFARKISSEAPKVSVGTVSFNRERAKRELVVSGIDDLDTGENACLVDDVAVSGRTIEVVRQAFGNQPQTVGVGLLYDSRKTLSRIGLPAIRYGLLYARVNGGTPPMNSVSTLRELPERLDELTVRYFGGSVALKRLIRGETA